MHASTPRILLRVASGPRRGFGHVVRALRLADQLTGSVWISCDGPMPPLSRAPHVQLATGGIRTLDTVRPDLLVLDTPVAADGQRWLTAARRRGLAVASIHDRGIAPLPSDLAIDGSLASRGGISGARRTLVGPRFMVIDPRVASGPHASVDALLVVIALGGGPRVGLAQALAEQIVRLTPRARVVVAAGFVAGGAVPSAATSSIQWLGPRESLVDVLSQAAVAVVAGGVTLYEAAALGVPTVAVPIVAAQRPTVRAFARAGATITPRSSESIDPGAIAAAVRRLMVDRTHARRLAARGRQLVDGRGTERVVRALHALAGAAR